LHGRRAQWRSRPSATPPRQRLTLDGREHDGGLAISWDDAVHGDDFVSIDAVEWRSTRRAGVVGCTAAERFIRPPFSAFVTEASRRFSVPEHWIRAVMQVESNAKQRARSSKGAMGLMQIMPKTWTELHARYGLGADPYDPRDNILAGAAYIRELYDRYGVPGFLAAYNAGPWTL
jgi:soluble lytic murein transglycosylase-like protein